MAVELNGKRLDLMKTLLPTVSRITLLTNPIHPGEHLEVAEFSGWRNLKTPTKSSHDERVTAQVKRKMREFNVLLEFMHRSKLTATR